MNRYESNIVYIPDGAQGGDGALVPSKKLIETAVRAADAQLGDDEEATQRYLLAIMDALTNTGKIGITLNIDVLGNSTDGQFIEAE